MTALFAAPCNWREPFEESREYRTDIITAVDDTEQRIQLRETPIETWAFLVTADNAHEMGLLEAMLWDGQGKEWVVPYWPEQTTMTADYEVAPPGTGGFFGDNYFVPKIPSAELSFKVGDYAVFGDEFGNMEAVKITNFFAERVYTEIPLTLWPKGTSVVPAKIGVLADTLDIIHQNGEIAEAKLLFEKVSTVVAGLVPD